MDRGPGKLGDCFCGILLSCPANRIGYLKYSPAQLKIIQEVITLVIFVVFSVLYLKEDFRWNYAVGFVLMIAAVFFIFKKW
jgi:uncharacterized protein (DUF486 family)